jgi:hypothetical protein
MLMGAGRYLALMVACVTVPLYAAIILGAIFPQHFMLCLALGFLFMMVSVMGVTTYKNSKLAGARAVGLTCRKPGGKDTFSYILYMDDPIELPPEGEFKCYALQDYLSGDRYVFLLDHPFGDLLFDADEIIAGPWIATVPTSYVDGTQKREAVIPVSVFERRRPNWFSRAVLRRPEPATEAVVPIVYLHSTNKTAERVFAGQPLGGAPPSAEQLASAYRSFKLLDPEISAKVSLAEVRGQVIEKQDSALVEKAKMALKYDEPAPEEEGTGWKGPLIALGVISAAIAVILAVAKLAGAW